MTPEALLNAYDEGALWRPDQRDGDWPDLAAAYRDALAVRTLRLARGERSLGYKIGFTNRTIWERYRVYAPIWGPIWDTTVTVCDASGSLDLAGTCQPRIEPEIAFGFDATPPPDPTLDDLFDCIAWLAPSFEVVHSHCEDWKFTAPETAADGALHGRLLVGRRTPIRALAHDGATLDDRLAAARVELFHDDVLIDEGIGANVLDGPLHALRHFAHEMQRCPGAPAIQPGDIVTTGTWTDAWPVAPGQRWHSRFDAPFDPLEVVFR